MNHDDEIRNAKIYALYWKCIKAKIIGKQFGLTADQVRRICKRMRAFDPAVPKTPCKCGKPKSGAQHYCAECLRSFAAARRARMTPEQRRKENARSYTHTLVKRGKIRKQPCGVCSRYPSEAHHPDYNDPHNVLWLCRDHHMETHRQKEPFRQFVSPQDVELKQ
jgi:hypothetical protein